MAPKRVLVGTERVLRATLYTVRRVPVTCSLGTGVSCKGPLALRIASASASCESLRRNALIVMLGFVTNRHLICAVRVLLCRCGMPAAVAIASKRALATAPIVATTLSRQGPTNQPTHHTGTNIVMRKSSGNTNTSANCGQHGSLRKPGHGYGGLPCRYGAASIMQGAPATKGSDAA